MNNDREISRVLIDPLNNDREISRVLIDLYQGSTSDLWDSPSRVLVDKVGDLIIKLVEEREFLRKTIVRQERALAQALSETDSTQSHARPSRSESTSCPK